MRDVKLCSSNSALGTATPDTPLSSLFPPHSAKWQHK
jgi:hypothetical protein